MFIKSELFWVHLVSKFPESCDKVLGIFFKSPDFKMVSKVAKSRLEKCEYESDGNVEFCSFFYWLSVF